MNPDDGWRRVASRGEMRLEDAPVSRRPVAKGARVRVIGAQPVIGRSDVPIGWVQFCQERPGDCTASGPSDAVVEMTPERERQLASVNLGINRALKPVSDMEHYGVVQRWTIPTDGMASCHSYMLTKRQALERLGWPRSALLVTVVRTRTGEGHAVLTARTSRGDLILDNLTSRIVGWNQTGYRYLMRQSGSSPNMFVSLAGPRSSDIAIAARSSARTLPAAWWQSAPSRSEAWHPWR
jgi:predicted transglutaminase-like cysteine proteinase